MTKWILMTAIALGAVATVPSQLTAQSCTEGYEQCLNDTWHTSGFTRVLADIECFAAYVGCVRGTV